MTMVAVQLRSVSAVERTLQAVAVVAVFAMCLIMCWDVAFRYFLFRPLAWSQEVIQFLMAIMFCAGLPLATLQAGHITVDVVSSHFRGGAARIARLLVMLASAGLMIVTAYFCARFALRLMAYGDRTDWLGIPWHIAAWAASAAFAAAALSCFLSVHSTADGAAQ